MPATDDPSSHSASHINAESSDSEDQFTDAQSAPRSPRPTSPKHYLSPKDESSQRPQTTDETVMAENRKPEINNASVTPDDEGEAEDTPSHSKTPTGETPANIVEEAPTRTPQPEADTASDLAKTHSITLPNADEASNPDREAIVFGEVEEDSEVGETNKADEREDEDEDGDDDGFGDDFDDFEEGGVEEDFDDFDDGFQQPELSQPQESAMQPQQAVLPFPIPDFDGENPEDIMTASEAYLATLFPPESLDLPEFPPLSNSASAFTTPRSASLWSQLVAPPPLAPPDWIRSRTRRLFLVSLGVPVDLDEILPASKQKKLVLPSLSVPSSGSPRTSSDLRSVSRLRQSGANGSSTSVDTQGKPRKKKGPPPQPELDMVGARHLCLTTDEALDGMTDEELKSHVTKLAALEGAARDVLEYWQKRTDEKIADRETFEGVIENLVKHARKVRK